MNEIIAEGLAATLANLSFVSTAAGVVTEVTVPVVQGGGKRPINKRIPASLKVFRSEDNVLEVCNADNGKYIAMIPESAQTGIIFFEDMGVDVERQSNWLTHYKGKLRLVAWVNRVKLGADDVNSNIALIQNTIQAIPTTYHGTGISYTTRVSIAPKRPSPFEKYTLDEATHQFLIYPYDYFMLIVEYKAVVANGCSPTLYNDPAPPCIAPPVGCEDSEIDLTLNSAKGYYWPSNYFIEINFDISGRTGNCCDGVYVQSKIGNGEWTIYGNYTPTNATPTDGNYTLSALSGANPNPNEEGFLVRVVCLDGNGQPWKISNSVSIEILTPAIELLSAAAICNEGCNDGQENYTWEVRFTKTPMNRPLRYGISNGPTDAFNLWPLSTVGATTVENGIVNLAQCFNLNNGTYYARVQITNDLGTIVEWEDSMAVIVNCAPPAVEITAASQICPSAEGNVCEDGNHHIQITIQLTSIPVGRIIKWYVLDTDLDPDVSFSEGQVQSQTFNETIEIGVCVTQGTFDNKTYYARVFVMDENNTAPELVSADFGIDFNCE